MKLSEKLRQKANERLASAQKIRETALTADRLPNEEEAAQIAALEKDAEGFEAQAKQAELSEKQTSAYTATSNTHPLGNLTVHERFEDDPMRGFKDHRDFIGEVCRAFQTGKASEKLKSLTAGSDEQGIYSDPHGGFLVPSGMLPNILSTSLDTDPVGGRTTKVPMATSSIEVLAKTDKAHNTSVTGGLTVARRAETGAISASRMTLEKIKLEAFGLFGMAYETEELLSRSPISFYALIDAGFRTAFADKLTTERISGTGVGQYLGILKSPALISVAKESEQANDTINGTNLIKMRAQAYGYNNAVWMVNPECYPQLAAAHIALTNASVPLFSPARGEDVPDMILGRPVIWTEYASAIGDVGDIMLVNWSEYLEGVEQPLQSAESVHVRFETHERVFKFWTYNAGAPWWRSAITPVKGAATLSPYVTLAAR